MLPPNKLSDSIEELHGIKMTTTPLLRYTKINKSDPKREGGAHVDTKTCVYILSQGEMYPSQSETGKIYPDN